MLEKIKEFIKEHWEEIILVIGVILISLLSFAIGYITAKHEEKEPIKIEKFQAPSIKFQTNTNDQNSKLFGLLGD
jgi:predicted negative regulator of RcsB-dependent stress response